ncbi:hypothetical protein YC2023_041237 [Brassica napus]
MSTGDPETSELATYIWCGAGCRNICISTHSGAVRGSKDPLKFFAGSSWNSLRTPVKWRITVTIYIYIHMHLLPLPYPSRTRLLKLRSKEEATTITRLVRCRRIHDGEVMYRIR